MALPVPWSTALQRKGVRARHHPMTGKHGPDRKRPVVAVTLRVFSEFRRGSVSVQATFDI